jgi:hypothetical protein
MYQIVFAAGILAAWLTESPSAQAQDCEPLKPSLAIDTEVRNITEARANVLLKSLGSGNIKNDYQRIEKSQPFSNPDDANRWNSFIYMLCTLLRSSSLSDNDKIASYFKLVELAQQPPPGGSSEVLPLTSLLGAPIPEKPPCGSVVRTPPNEYLLILSWGPVDRASTYTVEADCFGCGQFPNSWYSLSGCLGMCDAA